MFIFVWCLVRSGTQFDDRHALSTFSSRVSTRSASRGVCEKLRSASRIRSNLRAPTYMDGILTGTLQVGFRSYDGSFPAVQPVILAFTMGSPQGTRLGNIVAGNGQVFRKDG